MKISLLNSGVLLAFFCVFMISCTEQNTPIESCLIEKIVDDKTNQDLISYSYTTDNKLKEVVYGNAQRVISYEYLDEKVDALNLVFTSSGVDSCIVDTYSYNDQGSISKIEHKISRNSDCSMYEVYATTTYHYDLNQVLDHTILLPAENQATIPHDSIISIYDSRQNLVKAESFQDGEIYQLSRFKYDEQVNPLQNYLSKGENNIVEEYHVIYSAEREITFTYMYEYNELGIPTNVEEFSTDDFYQSKNYTYSLACK